MSTWLKTIVNFVSSNFCMTTEDTGHSAYFEPIRKQGYIFFVIFSFLKDKELILC